MEKKEILIVYKRVKHANLRVKATGEVILTAPVNMDRREIEHILKKRAAWIRRHLEFLAQNIQPKKELVSGESLPYLGKDYCLRVIAVTPPDPERVVLGSEYLELHTRDISNYKKKYKLLESWYKGRAEQYFREVIDQYRHLVGVEIQTLRIRPMKTRWGSCNYRKAYINLNLELIKKPREAIEYVVLHELTHLLHPGHGKNFYDYLSSHMPDWKRRKKILES